MCVVVLDRRPVMERRMCPELTATRYQLEGVLCPDWAENMISGVDVLAGRADDGVQTHVIYFPARGAVLVMASIRANVSGYTSCA